MTDHPLTPEDLSCEVLTEQEQDRDGYESYFAAIAEIRRRRVAAGLEEPLEEERETE